MGCAFRTKRKAALPVSFRNLAENQRRRLPGYESLNRDVLNSLFWRVWIVASLKPKLFCGVTPIGGRDGLLAVLRASAGANSSFQRAAAQAFTPQ